MYKTPCHIMFDSDASEAMLNRRFNDKHPILHQYPKYPINTQPIQVANDQCMTVKEAVNYTISFGGHFF